MPQDIHGTSARTDAELAGELRSIDAARRMATRHGEAAGLAGDTVSRLCLILEELITNAVTHGGASGADAMRLALIAEVGGTRIELIDNGVPFDPRTDLPPDPREGDYADAPPGGLGWPLILHYCSLIGYRRRENRNHLTLSMPAG